MQVAALSSLAGKMEPQGERKQLAGSPLALIETSERYGGTMDFCLPVSLLHLSSKVCGNC